MSNVKLNYVLLASVGLSAISANAAHAQSAPAQVSNAQIEEIVVTAQHRVENLQTVPLSAQVVGGATLARQNITSLNTATQTIPSVFAADGGRSNNLYVRGTGSGSNTSFDQSVGIFIDDIYHGRSRFTAGTFLDLDRLEVLKGPQSTFFGNNAIAGAFNIVTAKPTDYQTGWVRALISPGGGSGGQYAIEGAESGPISDTLTGRITGTFNGQRGWLTNVGTGQHAPNARNYGGRAALTWKPTDRLDMTLKVEGSHNRSFGEPAIQIDGCPAPAPFTTGGFCALALAQGLPIGIDSNRYTASPGTENRMNTYESTLTTNYRIGEDTLTSVTGYYGYNYKLNLDADGLPAVLIQAQTLERYHQFSQELRLASPSDGTIQYMVGAYFQSDHLDVNTAQNFSFQSPKIAATPALASLVPYLPLAQAVHTTQDERVYSAFGSLKWNVSSQFSITGGLRATWVAKNFDWNLLLGTATSPWDDVTPMPPALQAFAGNLGIGKPGSLSLVRHDRAIMPSAKLQYQITPRAMVYFSYSRGFKAGGFNSGDTSAVSSQYPFAPEHVNAYEFGLKSELFNRKVLFNLDVFRSDYSNLQTSVTQLTGAGSFISLVRNAATSRAQGVELEAKWVVTPQLQLMAAGSYLESTYLDYPNGPPTIAQTAAGIPTRSFAGLPTAFAPKWSGSITGNYTLDLSPSYRLATEVTGIFRTKYYTLATIDPLHIQGGYVRLDARISLEATRSRWAFDIIGKNLTNQSIVIFSADMPTSPGSVLNQKEQPRNVAFQVRYKW